MFVRSSLIFAHDQRMLLNCIPEWQTRMLLKSPIGGNFAESKHYGYGFIAPQQRIGAAPIIDGELPGLPEALTTAIVF